MSPTTIARQHTRDNATGTMETDELTLHCYRDIERRQDMFPISIPMSHSIHDLKKKLVSETEIKYNASGLILTKVRYIMIST